MTARVLKWTVPVDDYPHLIGTGHVLQVACQFNADSVEVWTLEDNEPAQAKPVQVFGTGQPVPHRWHHIGSAIAANGFLVWHVFEAPPEQWGADQTGATP